MPKSWALIWNDTAEGLCEGGQHLKASRLLPRDTGVGQCHERSLTYVVPTTERCNPRPRDSTPTSLGPTPTSLGSASTWWVPSTSTPTAAAEHSAPEVLRFTYISQHAAPVLHVLVRGNCRAVPLEPSLSATEAAALCIGRSPHALCGSVEQPKLYAGMHLAEAHETPLLLQLDASAPRNPHGGPHYSKPRSRGKQPPGWRTLSLLDTGRCERCRAPAAVHAADAVHLVRRLPLGACCPQAGPFNLTVEVRFTPAVRGPHLIYAREEFASLEVALRAGRGAPAADDAERGRGSYLGGLVPGSPFEHLVRRAPVVATAAAGAPTSYAGGVALRAAPRAALRTCVAADFADLSRAAFIAPDAGTLALPRSQWRLSPRGCTVARHAVTCDAMASCLRTRRISLLGDSMMERLRFAFSTTLLPGSHTPRWAVGGWYFSPCLNFNPRFLVNKRSYNGSAQLGLSECDETFRQSRDEVARCGGRANISAWQIFADFKRRHAEARSAVGAAAAAKLKLAPECGATLVLNLGGLHTAAWGGLLTMEGYGGAVRTALRLALDAGFAHIVCLATAAAHPVAYPPLESMPPLFFGLNAPRTRRTAELAAVVAAEFPRRRVSVVDAHAVTALLGEEAGLGCHDIRHQDFFVYRQVASILLGSICA